MTKAKSKATARRKKDYGISRMDQPRNQSHGWYVRVRVRGKQRRKFFSDKVYGTKKRAREEAENYRDQLVIMAES